MEEKAEQREASYQAGQIDEVDMLPLRERERDTSLEGITAQDERELAVSKTMN